MGVLLKICCMFSKYLFLRTPLQGCFCMLGKHDVITVYDQNGKHKEQKRIFTMTIREAYSSFIEEYTEITVGKSKFAELRPEEVFLLQELSRFISHISIVWQTVY